MYYRLDTEFGFPACLLQEEGNLGETLMSGQFVDAAELELPWPFSMRCDNDPDMRMGDFYSECNVMSQRLVQLLLDAGVDNLQVFPAAITHTCNGKQLDDYRVVNVVGLVAAADMTASTARPLADMNFFEKLVIDPAKARDLPIFRLAESRTDVIVSERIARLIEAGDFVDISLEPVGS